PDPPRDFTLEQLKKFNGVVTEDDKFNPDAGKIYISLKGEVYDVTAAANMYGPGASYHLFAGRDASRALAKMSFDADCLDNPDLSGECEGWSGLSPSPPPLHPTLSPLQTCRRWKWISWRRGSTSTSTRKSIRSLGSSARRRCDVR
ncbi:MAG: hypothetical protein GWP75_09650, partial [Planctomycetia bacterium]|nr:hypothetical protein [Planctomycetia bacterium]